jgi:hypothetical protein
VRAALVVAIAIALPLGACGGNGDSNPGTTSSGNPEGTTGKSARPGQTQRGHKKGSKGDGRAQKRRQTRGGGFQTSGNVFFFKGRLRCRAIPVEVLARIYLAKSDNPKDVASAYADRESPAPIYRHAAVAGCLAGIESRGNR